MTSNGGKQTSLPRFGRGRRDGASAAPRRLDRRDVDLPHVIMALKARFASSPPAASASVSTRGVICQEIPHRSLHQPQALSWPPLPTMAFQ